MKKNLLKIKKKQNTILFVLLIFMLYSCTSIYTNSRNTNWNRTISIKTLSGNVSLNISGHISEDIYSHNYNDQNMQNSANYIFIDSPVVSQGKETINQNIILYEMQEFKYTLTTAEVVIVNVKSIDDSDAILVIFERRKEKKYKIDGQNKLGQIITFKN